MSNKQITPEEAKDIILSSKGKFFTVQFVKKSTGELRKMSCTLNMKSKLKGGESTINKDYQIPVVDTVLAKQDKYAIRSFDVNTLKHLTINKQDFDVLGGVVR